MLPRVYGMFPGRLSDLQRASAAALYVGREAQVTGTAALQLYGIRRLPENRTVQVLVPATRCVQAARFVQRDPRSGAAASASAPGDPVGSRRPCRGGCRAAVRLRTTTSCPLPSAAIMSRRTTLAVPRGRGGQGVLATHDRLLRLVLIEARKGSRSVPEAEARALFLLAGLPKPLVNHPIEVNGEVMVPDFLWPWFIVEVDSKEWHLLEPGSWERTQARRVRLEAGGYHVLPITPQQIRQASAEVLAAVRSGYQQSLRRH